MRSSYNIRICTYRFCSTAFEQDVLDAKEAFLAKPFLLRELATKIQELFEVKSASHKEKKQSRAS